MFVHAKVTLYFNFKRQGRCLQALRMRVNTNFGPPCRDAPITWKKRWKKDADLVVDYYIIPIIVISELRTKLKIIAYLTKVDTS